MLMQKRKLRVVVLGGGFEGLEISARLSARIGYRLDLTLSGMYGADVLVIALGAYYDIYATPGLSEAGHEFTAGFNGKATCYVEFGEDKVGRADVDFFTDPYPTGIHYPASAELSH